MKLSVIIPVVNEAANLPLAIASAVAAGADEIIVADGGSTDGSCELAAALPVRVLHSSPGRAIQQNLAASQAQGEVLLFLHADNQLPPSAGEQVRRSLARQAVQFGGFRQRIAASGMGYRCLEWASDVRVRVRGTVYGDQGLFIRKAAFEQIGGFPSEPILEDLLLSRALVRHGRTWPVLLDGPLLVSARRWQKHGLIRQTLRNRKILWAHWLGYSPTTTAAWYRRHDAPDE